ncbi:hypothetical protein [Curtobacterium phage Parvaparticeps]|nr:hypothetical protein [Curtobacterium phage Parvaparticeps]
MTQTNVGFNGTLAATDWAKHAPLMFGGRCLGGPSEVQLSQVASTRAISASAGRIGGDGVVTILDAAEQIAVPAPQTGGQWYLLVNQRVWATKVSTFEIRNGATTSGTFGFLPPTAFPASLETNAGTKADVPVAWLWTNTTSTNVYIFPLLLPTEISYPRSGTQAQRSATLGTSIVAPTPWNQYWAQRVLPTWYDTDLNLLSTYQAQYNVTNNQNGIQGAAGWYPVADLANPLRYLSEAGLKTGASMTSIGDGVLGYARDTQGMYYRRNDGRTVRLDSQPSYVTACTGSSMTPKTDGTMQTFNGTQQEKLNSDTSVFYDRTDGVIRVNVAGWYYVDSTVKWAYNVGTSYRYNGVTVNDVEPTPPIADYFQANGANIGGCSGWVHCEAGDYIKASGYQTSSASMGYSMRLSATLVYPDTP